MRLNAGLVLRQWLRVPHPSSRATQDMGKTCSALIRFPLFRPKWAPQ